MPNIPMSEREEAVVREFLRSCTVPLVHLLLAGRAALLARQEGIVALEMKERSKETLTLTKMNWNSSATASRACRSPFYLLVGGVGELMCELSDNATPKPSYRFYI
jgi:hypothetical protein